MHSASLLLDSEHRVIFSSYFAPGVKPDDVLGRRAWECVPMTTASRKSIRDCISAVMDTSKPHFYTLDSPLTGVWRTMVHPCSFPVVRYLLESRQVPEKLMRLTAAQLGFCRLALTMDSKQLAKALHCSLQTVSNRRTLIAKKLNVEPADLRCHLAGLRHWLE